MEKESLGTFKIKLQFNSRRERRLARPQKCPRVTEAVLLQEHIAHPVPSFSTDPE